ERERERERCIVVGSLDFPNKKQNPLHQGTRNSRFTLLKKNTKNRNVRDLLDGHLCKGASPFTHSFPWEELNGPVINI
ncbi:hypothetical protein ACQP3D_29500, partial [Escherichia coli]